MSNGKHPMHPYYVKITLYHVQKNLLPVNAQNPLDTFFRKAANLLRTC